MKVEKSIHINCPPEKVFAFVSDFSNAPKWMVGFVESRILTDGAVHLGTQYMFVSKFLGQKMEMKSEITVWEPPARYEYKTVASPVPMLGGFSFEPEDGSTLVTAYGEGEFGGIFKLAKGLIKSQMDKQMEDTMKGLKQALEG